MLKRLANKKGTVPGLIVAAAIIWSLSAGYSIWYTIENPDWEAPLTAEEMMERMPI